MDIIYTKLLQFLYLSIKTIRLCKIIPRLANLLINRNAEYE